jgi:hypothetical protein
MRQCHYDHSSLWPWIPRLGFSHSCPVPQPITGFAAHDSSASAVLRLSHFFRSFVVAQGNRPFSRHRRRDRWPPRYDRFAALDRSREDNDLCFAIDYLSRKDDCEGLGFGRFVLCFKTFRRPEIGLADYKAGDGLGIYQLELFHLAIELSCFGGRIRSSNSRQLFGCKIGPGEDASVTAL